MTFVPRYYQIEAVQSVFDYWEEEPGHPLVDMATGCHAAGTKILMYDGTTKSVELVAANDNLMGPDSRPRRVLRTVSGREMMYRVTPTKGESFVVNEGHILSLKTTNEGKKATKFPNSHTSGGRVDNVVLKDYLGKAKYWKHIRKLWRTGVDFNSPANDNIPVPAYVVGAMLGDGSLVHAACLTNMDQEVINEVCDYAVSLGVGTRFSQKPDNRAWQISFPDEESDRSHRNRFVAKLEEAGLWGMICHKKAIPQPYKTGSRKTRLEVLAGLLDTDGHLSKGQHFDFISKSRQLSEDVVFVARSLGLAAYLTECEKFCQTGGGGTYWRVSISGDVDMIPNRVERQKAKPRQQIKNPLVTGFKVEPVGIGDYYGFALDGDHLYLTDDFTVHHNTGKSGTLAMLIKRLLEGWSHLRIMVVTHVEELVQGNFEEFIKMCPFSPSGIFAASLGRRDHHAQVLFGQLQTVWDKAALIGHIDILMIDEVHLVPSDGNTMYRKLIAALLEINPDMKLVGFTATPYRLDSGRLDEGEDRLFDRVVYTYTIAQGIDDGYLTRLTSKPTDTHYDMTGVHRLGGDFKKSDLAKATDKEELTRAAVGEVMAYVAEENRKTAIFFCNGIEHATHVRDEVRAHGKSCAVLSGKTPKGERRQIIEDLKAGRLWGCTNDNVLSTGTNIPGVDLIVDMAPTESCNRYVQRAGRGTRVVWPAGFKPDNSTAEERKEAIARGPKPTCRYMNFAANIERHGPVDCVQPKTPGKGMGEAPIKICDVCEEICAASARICPNCGNAFIFEEKPKFTARPTDVAILGTVVEEDWRRVTERRFAHHPGKDGKADSVKIAYMSGFTSISDWLGPGHTGFFKTKTDRFWRDHGGATPYPKSPLEFLQRQGEIRPTAEISVVPNKKYWNVKAWKASEEPANDNTPPAANDNAAWRRGLDDDIPF